MLLQESLNDRAKNSSRSWSLRGKLVDAFHQHTDMIRFKEQPPISFDPAIKQRMFTAKPCSKLGMCICGAKGNGHRADQIHRRIAADLKRVCWSRQKEKSRERLLLESGEIVLRLNAADDAATELWYHVGYVNYTTWRLTFHKLLRMPGHAQPLEDAVLLKSVCMDMGAQQDQAQRCTATFMTSVQALAVDFNFELPCCMSLYAIVDSPATVPFERMKLGYVQVVACHSDSGEGWQMSIWKGQAAEDEAAAESAERRRLRPRARPSGPRQEGQQALQTQRGRRRQNEDTAEPSGPADSQTVQAEDSDEAAEASDEHAVLSASEAASGSECEDDGEQGNGILEALLKEMLPDPTDANSGHMQPHAESSSSSSGSDASSSSSGSSSSEAESEDDNEDEGHARGLGGPRAPPVSEHVFVLDDGLGQIRYNASQNQLIARCGVHGDECRRRRVTIPSELPRLRGQGRPIGLLVSWLMRAHEDTSQGHVKMKPSPLGDRVAAREAFYAMEGGRVFADAYEREQHEGEQEEPAKIP